MEVIKWSLSVTSEQRERDSSLWNQRNPKENRPICHRQGHHTKCSSSFYFVILLTSCIPFPPGRLNIWVCAQVCVCVCVFVCSPLFPAQQQKRKLFAAFERVFFFFFFSNFEAASCRLWPPKHTQLSLGCFLSSFSIDFESVSRCHAEQTKLCLRWRLFLTHACLCLCE